MDDSLDNAKTMRSDMNHDTIGHMLTQQPDQVVVLASRYRIVRKLGEGRMGSVWLAEDTKLDSRQVAIKMLPVVLVASKRAIQQLKAEAKVAIQLAHPNIATLRAFEEADEGPFLVMDYIPGQTLEDLLTDVGTLAEDEVTLLFTPIAQALDYAHSQKVIHRDIKPSNILIREDGTPFITDFGIAWEMKDSMTRVTGRSTSGTLPYMSPEQLRGDSPSPAQDIYSFAATAYECLSGHPPFYRGQIEYQIINEHASPLAHNSPLSALVLQGLSKDPAARPVKCADIFPSPPSAKPGSSRPRNTPTCKDKKVPLGERGSESIQSSPPPSLTARTRPSTVISDDQVVLLLNRWSQNRRFVASPIIGPDAAVLKSVERRSLLRVTAESVLERRSHRVEEVPGKPPPEHAPEVEASAFDPWAYGSDKTPEDWSDNYYEFRCVPALQVTKCATCGGGWLKKHSCEACNKTGHMTKYRRVEVSQEHVHVARTVYEDSIDTECKLPLPRDCEGASIVNRVGTTFQLDDLSDIPERLRPIVEQVVAALSGSANGRVRKARLRIDRIPLTRCRLVNGSKVHDFDICGRNELVVPRSAVPLAVHRLFSAYLGSTFAVLGVCAAVIFAFHGPGWAYAAATVAGLLLPAWILRTMVSKYSRFPRAEATTDRVPTTQRPGDADEHDLLDDEADDESDGDEAAEPDDGDKPRGEMVDRAERLLNEWKEVQRGYEEAMRESDSDDDRW